MSTERVERIRAEDARVGDRIKAPEGRAFYPLTVAEHKRGLDPGGDLVELGTGWGSVLLAPGEMVERENWQVDEAEREIDANLRSRLNNLALLQKVAGQGTAAHTSKKEREALKALGVSVRDGAAANPNVAEEAQDQLDEYPLAVERTMVFEVVLGTGGPDDRLIFECSAGHEREADDPSQRTTWEIDRVLYRYSWMGSAERVLTGEDRATAEELARRVVPELVE